MLRHHLTMQVPPPAYLDDAIEHLRAASAVADGPVSDTAEPVTAQAGIVGAEPDRDDGDTMPHTL